MIYGKRFHGKSSVAMLLADVLAGKELNVLYVSNEEGVKGSLQEKLLRLKISSPIDFVEDYNPSQFRGYDAVFLDSTQTVGMKPDEFKALKKRYPNTSFVLVFKANRDGSSKGGSDWVTPLVLVNYRLYNCLIGCCILFIFYQKYFGYMFVADISTRLYSF